MANHAPVNGMFVSLAAEAGRNDWKGVSTTGYLPEDFERSLSGLSRQLFQMEVEAPGSTAGTVFSLEDMSRVMSRLHVRV